MKDNGIRRKYRSWKESPIWHFWLAFKKARNASNDENIQYNIINRKFDQGSKKIGKVSELVMYVTFPRNISELGFVNLMIELSREVSIDAGYLRKTMNYNKKSNWRLPNKRYIELLERQKKDKESV